jgi:hypothetical protein
MGPGLLLPGSEDGPGFLAAGRADGARLSGRLALPLVAAVNAHSACTLTPRVLNKALALSG